MAHVKKSLNPLAIVTVAVAVGSLSLNVIQFRSQRTADRRDRQSLTAFFVYADDRALADLYQREPDLSDKLSNLGLAQTGTVADSILRAHLEALSRSDVPPRRYPVASFLAIQNSGLDDLTDVVARSQDSVYASLSIVLPDDWVFVPLEFLPPGRDNRAPRTPDQMTIQYAGGQRERVTPGTRVTWLENRLIRAMVR